MRSPPESWVCAYRAPIQPPNPFVTVTLGRVVAQAAAFVGIVAGFWHISWIAGVTFLAAAVVAVGVHSAGYVRLERTNEPTS